MLNQIIITICLVAFSASTFASSSTASGRWQRTNKSCVLEQVEKVGQKVGVENCRIRFTIDGDTCKSANVTYRTKIGQVIKTASCYLDPDTMQLEVEVEVDGQTYTEVNVYLESPADHYDQNVLVSKSLEDRTVLFFSK
jgi:hypothetical protein